MKIYIIGMPGAGKTHFGRILARSLKLQFFDLDELIEKKEGENVKSIISNKGEPYFRQAEHDTLEGLGHIENSVVSCGGGAPMFHNNIDHMKNTGIVIWLRTDLRVIAKRIAQNVTRRPLFMGLNETQILEKLHEIYEKRKLFYAKADVPIDCKSAHDIPLNIVIQKVMRISKMKNKRL